ncbi:MAG TPA: hydrogen peroxide-inducible genes activator [Xanthobacteraceae bacterium]|jgi:LysR family hydrogen peroxide-inducible transcriptional activator|nr:hydrogen peroxide-inducible genes activator [Xanthobacteraceae bacterium]
MISLRQLRYFASLARHRHFGRAADDCAVTQPALSMQVRELEREIGVELVERRPGEVALTATGVEVAQRAERILAATRDLVDFARHRETLAGSLRLGIIPTIAPYLLPRLLPRLQRTYPSLRLDVRETQTATLIGELAAGDLDCLLLALPVDAADIDTKPLFKDRFLLAAPADEPVPRRTLKAEDVDQERLILLEEGHCLRDQAVAFCATKRHDSGAALGSTSLATVMQMVANGYGVTLVPEIAAELEVRDKRVILRRFVAPEPGRTIGLAWRKTSPRRSDFEALGEAVKLTAPRQSRSEKS